MDDRCLCGKQYMFTSQEEAWAFIDKKRAQGFTDLVNVHKCNEDAGIWHTTSKFISKHGKLSALERELQYEMATAKQQVVYYLRDKYRIKKEYKASVSEIRRFFESKGNHINVSAAVGVLKREGTITELDEKDLTRKGPASYLFALTEILEEVTKPKKEDPKPVANDKVPAQPKNTSITVAANPFDKVNERLDIIVTQLKGLATGYSDLVKRTSNPSGTDPQLIEQMGAAYSAIRNLGGRQDETLDIIKVIQDEVRHRTDLIYKELKRSSLTVDVPAMAVAEAVNARLSDFDHDSSFIYRVREEFNDRICKTEGRLTENTAEVVKNQQILRNVMEDLKDLIKDAPVPSSVANANDYREGIKEGIRLAAEMGLTVKSE